MPFLQWVKFLSFLAFTLLSATKYAAASDFRPPAVPLVTSDPYLSIWSESDNLTDSVTRHWTGTAHPLVSLIRIDGATYRLMGTDPANVLPMPQTSLTVTPTRSLYDFETAQAHVTLTFMTPALPHDLDALTRPVTYLTWQVRSVDGLSHAVSLYCSASSLLAVNQPSQKVEWAREPMGALTALRVGTVTQRCFDAAGDYTRIDWGNAYIAAPAAQATAIIGADSVLVSDFTAGVLPVADDTQMPRAASDNEPVLSFAFDLGQVASAPISRHLMIGYDEEYEVSFFGKKLRPYWRRNGATPATLFQSAERDYPSLQKRCQQFDTQLMSDMTRIGGPEYAQIGALAYRQSLAGCGIAADSHNQPLLFTKENTSNGDIATVDVIFPMDPMLILFSPTLAKASIVPDLIYGASRRWKFPNAPHDLGTYPIARGTDNGGEQMPVEESGNILLICDAIAREEGNADFVTPWWPQLSRWAHYLKQFGNDPADQLCTDDFMGHLAHNANLSVKAILALAAYADLCRMRGETQNAQNYHALAKGYARHWMAASSDGDHSRLAFDKPNSWSQKYNLVWDQILGLGMFPPTVARSEIAQYKRVLQPYGVPLDSRTHLTKSDWTLWSASLADNSADFKAMIAPLYSYLNQTTARLPFADSYVTDDIHSAGMHARPVIGGVFLRMLTDAALWKKWSQGDTKLAAGWAGLPIMPPINYLVPPSTQKPALWKYTTTANPPTDNWMHENFDDSGWKQGLGGFGQYPPGGVTIRTPWTDTPGDIWLRRKITMPAKSFSHLKFLMYHDEDVEIYVNGVIAASEGGYNNSFDPLEISHEALALLKPGATVTLAVHVHQTVGGQGIDLGIANVPEPD